MAAIDLVASPNKRMLLCYIAFGPTRVGFPFWKENNANGYHSLPSDLKESISEDVFHELTTQLLADRLIKQEQSKSMTEDMGEAIMYWRTTAKGRRIARALFGDEIAKAEETHSIASFSKLLSEKFARRSTPRYKAG